MKLFAVIAMTITQHYKMHYLGQLTKNADIGKYGYSGYGIGFDGKGCFWHPSGTDGKNVIILGTDMSSSTKIDNRYLNSW